MNKKLTTLDLVAIAQMVGADKLITRISNEFRFGLTNEQRNLFRASGLPIAELDKLKNSEFVWSVQGYTTFLFDNYAHALHMALTICRIRIDEKDIDFDS